MLLLCITQLYENSYTVYMARKCHSTVAKIDTALSSFDHKLLCDLVQVEDYKNLIGEIIKDQDSDHDLPSSIFC